MLADRFERRLYKIQAEAKFQEAMADLRKPASKRTIDPATAQQYNPADAVKLSQQPSSEPYAPSTPNHGSSSYSPAAQVAGNLPGPKAATAGGKAGTRANMQGFIDDKTANAKTAKVGDDSSGGVPPPGLATPGTPEPDLPSGKRYTRFVRAAQAQGQKSPGQALARRDLTDYVRANGNMAVPRRLHIIGEALTRLGYSDDDARDIALDAPLNAAMYNNQALLAALEYAYLVSQPPSGAPGTLLAGAFHGGVIPDDGQGMPAAARQALIDGRRAKQGLGGKTKGAASGGWSRLQTLFNGTLKPISDRMSNVPVPGGIGGLLAINLFFLAAIVPVNGGGQTRMELLWLTMLNRTRLTVDTSNKTVIPDGVWETGLFQAVDAVKKVGVSIGTLGNNAAGMAGLFTGGALPIIEQTAGLPPQAPASNPTSTIGPTPPSPPLPPILSI